MIKEAYCSDEVAKLLKEKGFDGDGGDCECHMFYHEMTDRIMPIMEIGLIPDYDDVYFAPTHQMAMKWLREKYNIHISIQPDFPSDKDYKMCWCWSANILHENCISLKGHQCYIETYEEAVETAIKYCLENLI